MPKQNYQSWGGRRVVLNALIGGSEGLISRAREMPRAELAQQGFGTDGATPPWQPLCSLVLAGGAICAVGCNNDQTWFANTGIRSFAWYLNAIETASSPPMRGAQMDWQVRKALFGAEVPLVTGTFNFQSPDDTLVSHVGLIIAGDGGPLCNEVQLWGRMWPAGTAPEGSSVTIAASLIVDRLGDGGGGFDWDPTISTTVARVTGRIPA